jgi:hypothetical protein
MYYYGILVKLNILLNNMKNNIAFPNNIQLTLDVNNINYLSKHLNRQKDMVWRRKRGQVQI